MAIDWTALTLTGVISAILNALLLGIWKPWGKGYGEEKGKNVARKEDLDAILAEVRAVTITQKEIEAKLVGDYWQRQTNWTQKRHIYGSLLSQTRNLQSLYRMIPTYIQLNAGTESAEVKYDVTNRLNLHLKKICEAMEKFSHASSLAKVFASQECGRVLDQEALSKLPEVSVSSPEWALAEAANFDRLMVQLIVAAKSDLLTH